MSKGWQNVKQCVLQDQGYEEKKNSAMNNLRLSVQHEQKLLFLKNYIYVYIY